MTLSDRDPDPQTTTQRNKSDTEGQLTDSGHQTIAADHGLRVRSKQKGPETKYITQQPTAFKNLPYFYQDNRHTLCSLPLNIIQGLKDCPHLQNIRDDCAKQGVEIPNLTMSEPVTTDILTQQQYLEQERQGCIP